MRSKSLPEDLAWSGEHASEIAIVAIADAQTGILPPAVVSHVESCARCSDALAEATMLSIQTGEALAAVPVSARELAPESARATLPWRALVAAMFVAALGAVPALLDARGVSGSAVSLVRSAPIVMKGLRHLAGASGFPLWMTLGSAALLVLVSIALTRALPSPASASGSPGSRRIES